MSDQKSPDLIWRSGREDMPLEQRLTWLRSTALLIEHERSRLGWGSEVHTLGVLLESMHRAWPVNRWVNHHRHPYYFERLSLVECDVMAYRRGGPREVDRLHWLRRELAAARSDAGKARLRWRYPTWSTGERLPLRYEASPWIDLGGEA
jgi:hypothetical protein